VPRGGHVTRNSDGRLSQTGRHHIADCANRIIGQRYHAASAAASANLDPTAPVALC
jgi:hypothetical protein